MGGCRIVKREYINSGNFKNWAIPQATHPWVLIVDSDERVTPEGLAARSTRCWTAGPPRDGYHIYRSNYFLGHLIRHGGWGSDKVLRLFRRDLGRYQGESDHAEVLVGTTSKSAICEARLEHFTYWSYDQYFRKLHRYTVQSARKPMGRRQPGELLANAAQRLLCGSCTATSFAWAFSTGWPACSSAR